MCVSFRRAGRGGWRECGVGMSVGLEARDARFQAVLPASRSKNQPICTKPERDAGKTVEKSASRSKNHPICTKPERDAGKTVEKSASRVIVSVLPEHTRRRVGNVEDFV